MEERRFSAAKSGRMNPGFSPRVCIPVKGLRSLNRSWRRDKKQERRKARALLYLLTASAGTIRSRKRRDKLHASDL